MIDLLTRRLTAFQQVLQEPSAELGPVEQHDMQEVLIQGTEPALGLKIKSKNPERVRLPPEEIMLLSNCSGGFVLGRLRITSFLSFHLHGSSLVIERSKGYVYSAGGR